MAETPTTILSTELRKGDEFFRTFWIENMALGNGLVQTGKIDLIDHTKFLGPAAPKISFHWTDNADTTCEELALKLMEGFRFHIQLSLVCSTSTAYQTFVHHSNLFVISDMFEALNSRAKRESQLKSDLLTIYKMLNAKERT